MSDWPSGLTYRPIQAWPGALTPSRRRRTSPFRSTLSKTLAQLTKELAEVQARNTVVQLAIDEADLRNDGLPRARAYPEHPGIILSFETPDGPISFPCDTFTEWADNLRAIVLTMERLRAVERYGVTKRGEQYAGWRAITARPSGSFANADEALQWLIDNFDHGRDLPAGDLLRLAMRHTHPDMSGDPAAWQRYTEARELLDPPARGTT